jgi:predicted DNA-binding ribbon-helix-helix protein
MNSIAPPPARLLPNLSADDFGPEFRVVTRGGTRRGIRLERAFWASLKQLAERRKCTIGELIEEIAESHDDSGNLTSAIRVVCIGGLAEENQTLRKLASIRTISGILAACPSPAFALTSSKSILSFNTPFQQLVRRHLPDDEVRQGLRLALDINVADIFARLEASGETSVPTGFVIGAGDRRYRGQLSVARAPIAEPELLMAFVFSGY